MEPLMKKLGIILALVMFSTGAYAQSVTQDGIRALTSHSITTSGTAASTASALTSGTLKVRLVATAAAFVAVGVTATSDSIYLPPNVPIVLDAGQGEFVSAIQVSSGGVVYVTEMSR